MAARLVHRVHLCHVCHAEEEQARAHGDGAVLVARLVDHLLSLPRLSSLLGDLVRGLLRLGQSVDQALRTRVQASASSI